MGLLERLFVRGRIDSSEVLERPPVPIFLLSWERPLYLWSSLDSLYHSATADGEIYIVDNDSQDPLVREVIEAFHRRGLFRRVTFNAFNDPDASQLGIASLIEESAGPYIIFMESDVVVPTDRPSWIARFCRIMDQNPKLGMLGSQVDKRDFVPVQEAISKFGLKPTPAVLDLLKAHSPERDLNLSSDDLSAPFNPPGRLAIYRKSALKMTGFMPDRALASAMRDHGWEYAITGAIVHRHLSFQNFYDYPDYDVVHRREFFHGTGEAGA